MNKQTKLKILMIIGFGIVFRTIACFVCSMHFEDVVIAIHLGDIIFKCFFIYQTLRLLISIISNQFNEVEANLVLKTLKKVFTLIVLLGCILRFLTSINAETTAIQAFINLIESAVLFLIFIVIELLVDVVFCIQAPKTELNAKDLILTNLSDYFWLNNSKSTEKQDSITNQVPLVEEKDNKESSKSSPNVTSNCDIDNKELLNALGLTIQRNKKKSYKVGILKKLNKKVRSGPTKK